MKKAIIYTFMSLFLLAVSAAGAGLFIFYKYGADLPDYRQLATYRPPITTRVYAGDGRLLAEYAIEKRIFVPVSAFPKTVIDAFLAAEDKNFYEHIGVDFSSVFRAIYTNLNNWRKNRRLVGASTITQQVAKNFLLSNELSYERKIKEAILALRIERAFSKDQILELYLNEIYLGFASYGVPAAALNYFDKSLDELTLGEAAFLAALPKAPNNYHPINKPEAARERRDWVLDRMVAAGFITKADARATMMESITVRQRDETEIVHADYFAEEVRRWLYDRYGEDGLYQGGMLVRTTLDPRLQEIADRILREGLIAYDRRHGWRGPIARIDVAEGDWMSRLATLPTPPGLAPWQLGVVLGLSEKEAGIGFVDGSVGIIPFEELEWARPWRNGQTLGPEVATASDVLSPGDVVPVEAIPEAGEGAFALRQVPDIEGALVAIDPHTGRVLAISGGFSFDESEFNRATQALRQPGSAFKPFVYLTALESGYTPADIILDGPLAIDLGAGLGKWKPENYSQKFYGPSTLRMGLEKSRNLMTVRLSQQIGLENIKEHAVRFGLYDNPPLIPAMALGANETTLLKITTGYAMLVNGGKRITPEFIERIQDRDGRTIYRRDDRPCPDCTNVKWVGQERPVPPDTRETIVDPRSAYQLVSLLEGVVLRGTGRRVREVGKPLGGKTGTTNESMDTWFIGFSPDLALGVFVGFDQPKSLGKRETGSSAAAPIFRDFMAAALDGQAAVPFRVPPGIVFARIDAKTGSAAGPATENVILEAFKEGESPRSGATALWTDEDTPYLVEPSIPSGTGGLY
ncbi:MAG: penicillin-binding protein 1A [Alphaproteobacteria bacterium]